MVFENEFYRELTENKFNALQILKDVCKIENDEVKYNVPEKFIASLFMVTEKDIDLPAYPEEFLTPIRKFLDNYCRDDREMTISLTRLQILEMINTVTRYRVYNCDNEKYIRNHVDRVTIKRRSGVHLDAVTMEDFSQILASIPDAKGE